MLKWPASTSLVTSYTQNGITQSNHDSERYRSSYLCGRPYIQIASLEALRNALLPVQIRLTDQLPRSFVRRISQPIFAKQSRSDGIQTIVFAN
jgi:hypothetical protein